MTVRMINDQMLEVSRMFRDAAGNGIIFGPTPDDVWTLVPFPAISELLNRIDEVLIDERLERFDQVSRKFSDLLNRSKMAAAHLNRFHNL